MLSLWTLAQGKAFWGQWASQEKSCHLNPALPTAWSETSSLQNYEGICCWSRLQQAQWWLLYCYGSLGRVIHLFFLLPFHCIVGTYCNLFIYSHAHRHLCYFQFGTITNTAATNILVQVFRCTCAHISFGNIPKSEISWVPQGICMFKSGRYATLPKYLG